MSKVITFTIYNVSGDLVSSRIVQRRPLFILFSESLLWSIRESNSCEGIETLTVYTFFKRASNVITKPFVHCKAN